METVERRESTDSAYLDLVTDIDYGPHGLITNLVNVNGTTLSNTYDSTQMYRLTRKLVSATGGDPDADLTTTTIYATVGDGFVAKTNANWATAHDATTGSEVDYTATTYDVKVGNTPTAYKIQRAFIPFDTSSIPDNAVITSAKLKVYVESKSNLDNDEEDFVTVVNATQPSSTELTTADYDALSTTEAIDVNERKDITDVSTSSYLTFYLNTKGKTSIDKTGYTKLALEKDTIY